MVRLTIYRTNNTTIEKMITLREALELVSNKVVAFAITEEKDPIYIRPYYRHTTDGMLNIFAEEEL